MEAASTSETSVNFYQTTQRYNPEDSHLHTRRRENLKSYLRNSQVVWKMQGKQVIISPLCLYFLHEYKERKKKKVQEGGVFYHRNETRHNPTQVDNRRKNGLGLSSVCFNPVRNVISCDSFHWKSNFHLVHKKRVELSGSEVFLITISTKIQANMLSSNTECSI
jgi:hypothetical protein